MTTQWRVKPITGGGPQSLWSSDELGAPGYQVISQWFEGETLITSRIQGQVTFSVRDTDPTEVEMGTEAAGAMANTFGIWAKKDAGASTPPLGLPQTGSINPAWQLYDQMTLVDLNTFHEAIGNDTWTATYAFAGGGTQSRGQRGPATGDTDVYLVYGFENAIFNPTTDSSFTLSSFYGFALTVELLFDHVTV